MAVAACWVLAMAPATSPIAMNASVPTSTTGIAIHQDAVSFSPKYGVVAMSRNAASWTSATAIANLVILPMAFLGGAFIPLDYAPAWLRQVSYAMPLRYLVTGMQNVMARGEGPASAVPAIAVMLALTAVLTLIAVRVFRWDSV